MNENNMFERWWVFTWCLLDQTNCSETDKINGLITENTELKSVLITPAEQATSSGTNQLINICKAKGDELAIRTVFIHL